MASYIGRFSMAMKRRTPVAVNTDVIDEGDTSPSSQKTDKGLERIVQAIQSKPAEQGEQKKTSASEGPRKTVNEIFRRRTGEEISRRQSGEAGASVTIEGPNLVTHIPDVVVQSDHRRPLPFRISDQAVLMFLDISGFTALCEKYSQAAKTGTEQLTKTLNGYMSALVSEIISYDGDILKFAGDAILSMWPVDSLPSMNRTTENVIQCALDIQRKHGTYTTNDGVTLKVKIGIAAGEIQILIIGNDEERTYIEVGRGIEDVNKAENMCEKGGDIVVAPGAWIHCQNLSADITPIPDTKFIKVNQLHSRTNLGYQNDRTIIVTTDMENLDRSIRNLIVPSKMILDQSSNLMGSHENILREITEEEERMVMAVGGVNMRRLRKSIITHFSRDKVHNLKLFISKPVLRKIEDGQPLEYLSEMRQVTMLFINLDVDRSTKYGYLLLMQRCYEVIYANAKRMRGCISKIFAFDKGCTFMVIFGLPGYKHENDSAHALSCAHAIYTELNNIVGLKQTSIGVTTGPTYCGIVGHNHRHEYTVIGRRVNMGARLMMHYRGKIICDNTTFYYSKLNETYFIVQEPKEMKGLQQVGTVREYHPQVNLKDAMDQIRAQQEQKPIIGRDDALAKFEVCLDRLLATDKEIHDQRTPIVIIISEVGMGRTRLLNAFIAAALCRSVTIVLCTLSIGNVDYSYYVVRTLLAQLIKCENTPKADRAKLLYETFKDSRGVLKHVPLLDKLLDADTEPGSSDIESSELVMDVVRLVVRHFAERSWALIFAVDDTHLMDSYSWKCMPLFAENDNTMLVLTKRVLLDQHIKNETAVAFIRDPKNLVLHCSSLSVFDLASIACQFLNVTRIPDSLDHVLRLNSMGIPSWIDLLLREYLYEEVIKIEPTLIFNHTETMVVPAPKDLMERITVPQQDFTVAQPARGASANFIDELHLEAVSPNAEMVCYMLIQQTDDLKVPASIASMIQARIDHMQEIDQNVLKSASIIGQFVFREILQHMLLPDISKSELGDSIQRLADSGAFACASAMKTSRGRAGVARIAGAFSGQTCTCNGINDDRPMRECRVLMFLSASLRMTAYEIMLEQNRRPLHMSAAHFLEEKIRRLSSKNKTMNESMLYESYLYEDESEERDEPSATKLRNSSFEGPPESPQDIVETKEPEPKESEQKLAAGRKKSGRKSRSMRLRKTSSRVSPTNARQPLHSQRLKTIIGGEGLDGSHRTGSIAVSEFLVKHMPDAKRRGSSIKKKSFDQSNTAAMAADLARLSDSVIVNYTGFERLGVLRIQYPQIAEQYRGAGNTQNTVFYLTEAAAACLALFDHHGAITHLREVNRIFRDLKRNKNPFEGRVANLDNWKPENFDEGQMECLIGQTLFGMEKTKRAVPHFQRALKLFGCEQVRSPLKMKIATSMELSRHAKNQDQATEWESRLLINQAHCLFYIFEDCVARNDMIGARYAAVQQFTKTEIAMDLLGQIEASTCMLKLAHLTNDAAGVREHETKAKIKCIVAMQNVRNDQVIRLTRMYWTAFEIHLARSPLTEAMESGLAASRMMMAMRGGGVIQVHMLYSLINALIYSDRVKDAVDVLDIIHADSARGESRCWYFSACIHLVLTMGVRVALMEDCIAYSDEILAQRMFVKRPQLIFCLACSLCLYYRRVRAEDRFEEWRKVAALNEPTRYDNFISAIGFLDLLECKLLQLSKLIGEMRRAMAVTQKTHRRSITLMNLLDKRYLEHIISKDFKFAEKITRHLITLEPRLMILQAYYAAIRDKMSHARTLLQSAIRRAQSLNNVSHLRWAKHNHTVWFKEPPKQEEAHAEEEDDVVPPPSLGLYSRSTRRPSRRLSASSVGSSDSGQPQKKRSAALSVWMRERGLAHTKSTSEQEGVDMQDQWLKSANSTFPYWYILNHVRNETRLLLNFSLPLPHWFAARMF